VDKEHDMIHHLNIDLIEMKQVGEKSGPGDWVDLMKQMLDFPGIP
jgi:hypothetical protein